MIDSVLLRRQCSNPSKTALQKFTWQGDDRAFYRASRGNCSATLFYYYAPDGKHYLSVETSLPKLVFGNNIQLLDESKLEEALVEVGKLASEHFGVQFDAFTARVGRVDYCYNFFVGEDRIYAYLRAAAEGSPAHLKRRTFGKIETVEFFNQSRKICCYDKMRESRRQFKKGRITEETLESSRGLLRIEVRYNNTAAVKRLALQQLNSADIRARALLNFDIAKSVLDSALNSLSLTNLIAAFDNRIDQLQKKYGYCGKLQRLAGFIQMCDVYGCENLVSLGIMKPSAYYKQRQELRNAGILVHSPYSITLPALCVR